MNKNTLIKILQDLPEEVQEVAILDLQDDSNYVQDNFNTEILQLTDSEGRNYQPVLILTFNK